MGNFEGHRPKISTKSSPAHGGEIMGVQLAAVKVDTRLHTNVGVMLMVLVYNQSSD